jgi:hypothetical protein
LVVFESQNKSDTYQIDSEISCIRTY